MGRLPVVALALLTVMLAQGVRAQGTLTVEITFEPLGVTPPLPLLLPDGWSVVADVTGTIQTQVTLNEDALSQDLTVPAGTYTVSAPESQFDIFGWEVGVISPAQPVTVPPGGAAGVSIGCVPEGGSNPRSVLELSKVFDPAESEPEAWEIEIGVRDEGEGDVLVGTYVLGDARAAGHAAVPQGDYGVSVDAESESLVLMQTVVDPASVAVGPGVVAVVITNSPRATVVPGLPLWALLALPALLSRLALRFGQSRSRRGR